MNAMGVIFPVRHPETTGHVVGIDRVSWDVRCSCGEVFRRLHGDGTLETSIAAAKEHVDNIEREAGRERREAARNAKTAERMLAIHGEKKTIELAHEWGISRSSALRFLHRVHRVAVKRRRDRTWPYGYLWSKED